MKSKFNLYTNFIIFYDCARQDESWMKWVLCKVYEKKRPQQTQYCYSDDDEDDSGTEVSWLDEVFMSLDDDDDDDDDLDETIMLHA